MVTDEQLIARLRSAMQSATADVFPRPGLLDGVGPGRARPFWRPTPGDLAIGLATAATLAVAVLAIVLLGHGRQPSSHVVRPQTVSPAGPLPKLRTELAILRRRQLPTDRIPAWAIAAEQQPHCSNCLGVASLKPGDTRLLTTIPAPYGESRGARERIYLVLGTVPSQWQNGLISGWRQVGRNGRGLHLSLVGLTTPRPHQTPPVDELLNYSALAMPAQPLTPRDVLITSTATVGVVPDGVTWVKWELSNPGQARPVTVYPRVRGNAAVAQWTPAPRSTGLINEQFLVGATWYDAEGHVIASFHSQLGATNKPSGK